MSLNPLTLINQVIEEHGSSTVQVKHLAMLKDEITILQRKNGELAGEVDRLQAENRSLYAQLQERAAAMQRLSPSAPPGDKCPFCNQQTGVLDELKPHPQSLLAHVGTKIGYYHCASPGCGRKYDRQIRQ